MKVDSDAIFRHFAVWPLVILAYMGLVSDPFNSTDLFIVVGVFCIFLVGAVGAVRCLAYSHRTVSQMLYVVLTAVYVSISGYIFIYHLLNLTGYL